MQYNPKRLGNAPIAPRASVGGIQSGLNQQARNIKDFSNALEGVTKAKNANRLIGAMDGADLSDVATQNRLNMLATNASKEGKDMLASGIENIYKNAKEKRDVLSHDKDMRAMDQVFDIKGEQRAPILKGLFLNNAGTKASTEGTKANTAGKVIQNKLDEVLSPHKVVQSEQQTAANAINNMKGHNSIATDDMKNKLDIATKQANLNAPSAIQTAITKEAVKKYPEAFPKVTQGVYDYFDKNAWFGNPQFASDAKGKIAAITSSLLDTEEGQRAIASGNTDYLIGMIVDQLKKDGMKIEDGSFFNTIEVAPTKDGQPIKEESLKSKFLNLFS